MINDIIFIILGTAAFLYGLLSNDPDDVSTDSDGEKGGSSSQDVLRIREP